MKNRIITLLLSITCVIASCLPTALVGFNHVEIEDVNLEEASETPTWDILYKNNDEALKAYQETYDRVYKETLENINKQQEDIQNNLDAALANIPDWYLNYIKNANDVTVKSVKPDGKGNIVVAYTNGVKETIKLNEMLSQYSYSPSYPKDCETIGYQVAMSFDDSTYNGDSGCFNYTISNINCVLTKVTQPTEYDPYSHFEYQISYDIDITNYSSSKNLLVYCKNIIVDDSILLINGNGHYTQNITGSSTSPVTNGTLKIYGFL